MSKQIMLMKKNDYCNRKDIESSSNNLANYDLVTKRILKISIVKILNSVVTMTLQIRQILIKKLMKTRVRYIRKEQSKSREVGE